MQADVMAEQANYIGNGNNEAKGRKLFRYMLDNSSSLLIALPFAAALQT